MSDRLVTQYNIEFYYKLNKNTHEDIIDAGTKLWDYKFFEKTDMLVYLRNYHQKPY